MKGAATNLPAALNTLREGVRLALHSESMAHWSPMLRAHIASLAAPLEWDEAVLCTETIILAMCGDPSLLEDDQLWPHLQTALHPHQCIWIRAMQWITDGDASEALPLVHEALAYDPYSPVGHALLCLALSKLGMPAASLALLLKPPFQNAAPESLRIFHDMPPLAHIRDATELLQAEHYTVPAMGALLFDSLDLPAYLLRALASLSYTAPTSIQERAIPLVLAGHDLLAEAQTGTGKTAAFALPIIKQLSERPADKISTGISVLVVVPTRELAQQVAAAFQSYSRYAPGKVATIVLIGGESLEEQLRRLRDGANVVVATPGRLLDVIERGGINLAALDTLVLDEADRLLDLGFSEELQKLLQMLPEARQNLLFSATLAPKTLELGRKFLKDPIRISIVREEVCSQILQRVIEVNLERRRPLLHHLIEMEAWSQVLVFVASKRAAHNLASKLRGMGLSSAALHSDLEQSERTRVLKQFKNGRQQVLVATDLACRGIDISGLSCVVNYDLPRSPDDYVHRIGRTGRAGNFGVAISFIDHESQAHFMLIEKRANIRLEREQVEGFALSAPKIRPLVGNGPIKGKRKSKKDKLREQAAKRPGPGAKVAPKA